MVTSTIKVDMLLALVVLAIAATPLSALIPGDSAPGAVFPPDQSNVIRM